MPCFLNGVSAIVGPVRYLVTVCVFSMRGLPTMVACLVFSLQRWAINESSCSVGFSKTREEKYVPAESY